jgi:hypothetical protein
MLNHRRDYYAGALLILLGLGAAYPGSQYSMGTPTRMGPGLFPTALGGLLALLGVIVAASASVIETENSYHGINRSPDWRGWSCICAGVVLFIVLAEYAGLLPATFACILVSALGDRTATLKNSLIFTAGVTLFGILLFSYVLRVQIPVLRGF